MTTPAAPEEIDLRAGPLTMIFEGGDLRFVRFGDHEICRRIFVAVRDRNWGTVAGSISNLQIQSDADSFRATYLCRVVENEIDFEWEAEILGESSGLVVFRMEGLARSTFFRARIGFNVLHPVDGCAGRTCRVRQVTGGVVETRFPKEIAAQDVLPGFEEMRAMSYEVAPGVVSEFEFEGDLFETEDQRNWTDATYKTFSTPLKLPFPVEIHAGSRISQTIRLKVDHPGVIGARKNPKRSIIFETTSSRKIVLPHIGMGMASHGQALSPREAALLRVLQVSHLRVDAGEDAGDPAPVVARALEAAHALGVPLELALTIQDPDKTAVLLDAVEPLRQHVASCVVFRAASVSAVRSRFPHWRIGTGSAADFYSLNQNPPRDEGLDFLAYAIHPQEHSFDDRSLVETLAIQACTVRQALQMGGGLPVHVTPVTLKPRFRAAATGPEPVTPPRELPPQVDIRQASLFGAGWTAISLKYLAEAGAASVTFYETSGWRGVIEADAGSPAPFPSLPGSVFPLYHVFADFAEFRGGAILPSKSTDPLVVDGLVLEREGRKRIILVNFTGEAQDVTTDTDARPCRVRLLDESCLQFAIRRPEEYRSARGLDVTSLEPRLPPFAVVTIDDYEK